MMIKRLSTISLSLVLVLAITPINISFADEDSALDYPEQTVNENGATSDLTSQNEDQIVPYAEMNYTLNDLATLVVNASFAQQLIDEWPENYPANYYSVAAAILANPVSAADSLVTSNSPQDQDDINAAYASLRAALDSLQQDHPVTGNDQVLTTSSNGLTLSFKGAFETLSGVYLDSEEAAIVGTPYTGKAVEIGLLNNIVGNVSKGSAVVTLTPDYLASLSIGTHTITLEFVGAGNRTATASFTISSTDPLSNVNQPNIPTTGDTGFTNSLVIMGVLATLAIACFAAYTRRRTA